MTTLATKRIFFVHTEVSGISFFENVHILYDDLHQFLTDDFFFFLVIVFCYHLEV